MIKAKNKGVIHFIESKKDDVHIRQLVQTGQILSFYTLNQDPVVIALA